MRILTTGTIPGVQVIRALAWLFVLSLGFSAHAGIDCRSNPSQASCYLAEIDKEIRAVRNEKAALLLREWLDQAYLMAAKRAISEKNAMLAEELTSRISRGAERDRIVPLLVAHWMIQGNAKKAVSMISLLESPWKTKNVSMVIRHARGVDPLMMETVISVFERSLDRVENTAKRISLYDALSRTLERYQYTELSYAIDDTLQSLVLQNPGRTNEFMRRRLIERKCARGDFISAYTLAASIEDAKKKAIMLKWVAMQQWENEGAISAPVSFDGDARLEIMLDSQIASMPKNINRWELISLVKNVSERVQRISSQKTRDRYYSSLSRFLDRKGLYEVALRNSLLVGNVMDRSEQQYRILRKIYKGRGMDSALEMAARINSQEAELLVYAIAIEASMRKGSSRQVSEYVQRIENLVDASNNVEPGVKAFGRMFMANAYMEMNRNDEAVNALSRVTENIDILVSGEGYAEVVIASVVSMYLKMNRRENARDFLVSAREAAMKISQEETRNKALGFLENAEKRMRRQTMTEKQADIRAILDGDGQGLSLALSGMYRKLDKADSRDEAITELLELIPMLSQRGYQGHVKNALQKLARTGVANPDVMRLLIYIDNRKSRDKIFLQIVEGFAAREDMKGFIRMLQEYPTKQQLEHLVWALEVLAVHGRKRSAAMKKFHAELWKKLSAFRGDVQGGEIYFSLALRQSRFYHDGFRKQSLEKLMVKMIADMPSRVATEIAISSKAPQKGARDEPPQYNVTRIQSIRQPEWRAYTMLLQYLPFAVGPEWESDWVKAIYG